jgi:hypothetical protein
MGQDWVRAHLRNDAPLEEVARLVREQARASYDLRGYWESHYDFRKEVPPLDDTDAHRRFGACFEALVRYVRDEDRPAGDGPAELRRTYQVTRNRVFPPEWRTQATRSFLPRELRAHVRAWRTYIEQLRQGQHRGYLRELFAHDLSLDVVSFWRQLRSRAERARERTNRWAQKPEVVDVRERILSTPEPPFHPAPVWAVWRDAPDAFEPRTIDTYHTLEKSGPYAQLLREWNRRVASNNRVSPHFWNSPVGQEPLEWQLRATTGPDMDDFFDWLEPAGADGMLLYFWG